MLPSRGREHELPEEEAELRLRELLRRLGAIRRGGSNNWALDGRHTATGRPLIANDPHQPLTSPSLMWVQHMNSARGRGELDVAGFSFVGTPGIQLGFNADVVWAATTASPDVSDLWDVQVTDGVVQVGDEMVEIQPRVEEIVVRGADPVTLTVEEVPGYGLLIPDDFSPFPVTSRDRRLLFNWTGFRPTSEVHCFLEFDRAGTVEEFERAVDQFEVGSFNWIAADVDGITYRSHVLVPDRGEPSTMAPSWLVLDGDDPSTFWTGEFLSSEQLPQSRGEARGWLASANNDPFGFTADGDVTDDPFFFGAFFNPGSRSQRIHEELERLTDRGEVTLEDMRTLQLDAYLRMADEVLPVVEEAWAAVPTDEALAEYRGRDDLSTLMDLMVGWDRQMVRESPGALAFFVFLNYLAHRGIGDDLSLFFAPILEVKSIYVLKIVVHAITGAFPDAEDLLQPGRDVVVLRALDAAAGFLDDHFGGVAPSLYRWGDFHGTRFLNPIGGELDGGWVPTDGATDTINQAAAPFFIGGTPVDRLESTGGVIFRLLASFDEEGAPQVEVSFPRGNGGEPDSPHWDDTLEDWVEGRYRRFPFLRAEVEAEESDRLTISP